MTKIALAKQVDYKKSIRATRKEEDREFAQKIRLHVKRVCNFL